MYRISSCSSHRKVTDWVFLGLQSELCIPLCSFWLSQLCCSIPSSILFMPVGVSLYNNLLTVIFVRSGWKQSISMGVEYAIFNWKLLTWCLYPHPHIFMDATDLFLNNVISFSPCVVILRDKVKNFYTRLPFQKLMGISIRNKMPMSEKSISNG